MAVLLFYIYFERMKTMIMKKNEHYRPAIIQMITLEWGSPEEKKMSLIDDKNDNDAQFNKSKIDAHFAFL